MTELDHLAERAALAAPVLAASSAEQRASWLRAVADALDAHVEELAALADEETALGLPRLRGEVARTSGQLRLFAEVVLEGSYLEAIVDDADPGASPPRPELRRLLVPLGPVAVYAASNFPFAFSVLGGDTASALAAGNPVIVKAHSGHPRLSARTAELAVAALAASGAPDGTLALVSGRAAGEALVQHPRIRAAGFTGSLSGGRALFDLAAGRPDPIPFYGELGSINPVVITPAADAARGEQLAAGLVGSFTLGSGQFCTKPGVVFVPGATRRADAGASTRADADAATRADASAGADADGPGVVAPQGAPGDAFVTAVIAATAAASGGRLLTERIAEAFPAGVERLAADPGVRVLARGSGASAPTVLETDAAAVAERPEALLEEVFGPTTLLVRYADEAELLAALDALPGSLTATLHSEPGDDVTAVLARMTERAGRVLFAGWPTGVAVTWSQHHGGPWPATTSGHTSVGATAIRRFLRPLVFQDAPQHLLPAALRDDALARIPHRRNGRLLG